GASSPITHPGGAPGTPAYMSPEQAQGRDVDERSDIFSFGAVLYELAAGEPPFAGESPHAVLHQIVYTEPKPIAELRPDLPADLADVIGQALEKDPERRVQRMDKIAGELDQIARTIESGAGSSLATQTLLAPVPRKSRRIPIVVLAACLFALAVAA